MRCKYSRLDGHSSFLRFSKRPKRSWAYRRSPRRHIDIFLLSWQKPSYEVNMTSSELEWWIFRYIIIIMWIVSGRGETQATFRSTGSFFEPVVNSMVVFKYWINALNMHLNQAMSIKPRCTTEWSRGCFKSSRIPLKMKPNAAFFLYKFCVKFKNKV